MRVITGIARGRKLVTLEGEEVVRPTTDRVKEAMFSIIQFDIPGKSVLDLFAVLRRKLKLSEFITVALSDKPQVLRFCLTTEKASALLSTNTAFSAPQKSLI